MNILAINGSPRKKGNTEILLRTIMESVPGEGHSFDLISPSYMKISPCIACDACKKGNHLCVLKDDMQSVYEKLDAADVIIFGTPIYWFGPSAQIKTVIDRLRPYADNHKLTGKQALVVTPAADGPGDCEPAIEMFKRSFSYLNMKFTGSVPGTAYRKGEILQDGEAMNAARSLGQGLLSVSD
ncbi:MAG: flavodoxin family protein [Spirochaetales bacterium]|nr:flavodoxin family protein [Spirochaetales bacterium]